MSLGCWIISGIGSAAASFMGWVFARVSREHHRKPDHLLTISSIRTVITVLETEDSGENDFVARATVSQKRFGA